MTDLVAAIDAIVDDLEANGGVPANIQTWRYTRPHHLTAPDDTPWLAVWPDSEAFTLTATPAIYAADTRLRIEYAIDASAWAETGPPEDSTHLTVARSIQQRLATYADGIPGATDLTLRLRRTDYDVNQALAWIASTRADIELLDL